MGQSGESSVALKAERHIREISADTFGQVDVAYQGITNCVDIKFIGIDLLGYRIVVDFIF
jgi:hypothetical protein